MIFSKPKVRTQTPLALLAKHQSGQGRAVDAVPSMTGRPNFAVQPCERAPRVAEARASSPRATLMPNWSWLAMFSLAAAAAVLLVASPVSGNEVKGLGFYPPFESFNARGDDPRLPRFCVCRLLPRDACSFRGWHWML